jgi:recombinational DNA repair protein RecR
MDPSNPDVEALAESLAFFVQESRKCPICNDVTKDGKCEKCLSNVAIDDARISIANAREKSIDVTEAEGLLDEAKDFHEKKFYSQTVKVLRPLEKILGENWNAGAYMLSIIDEAEEIALSLEADNMVGTTMIRTMISKANEAQENGQPLKAIVRAREALDLANKIARKYSDLILKEPEKRKRKKEDVEGPVCPSCGEEVEVAWIKCPVCKAALKDVDEEMSPAPKAEDSPKGEGPKLCPKCGEEIEDFWVKCLFCQASLTGGGD